MSNKLQLCALVQTADGKRILCTVEHTIPTPYSLRPDVHVRAVKGKPFGGQREIIVNQTKTNLFVERAS
jgi:hypothetical protein